MPTTPKCNHRRGQELDQKNRKNRLTEKAFSFHGGIPAGPAPAEARIRRPNTVPDLFSGSNALAGGSYADVMRPKLTKILLNVTVQGSVGAVQVLTSPESAVGDVIAAAVRQYTKEGRRPIADSDPARFDLHYSQFSLESLDREETVMALGSRNFFLCLRSSVPATTTTSSPSCSNEVEKATKSGFPWLKFMDFLK